MIFKKQKTMAYKHGPERLEKPFKAFSFSFKKELYDFSVVNQLKVMTEYKIKGFARGMDQPFVRLSGQIKSIKQQVASWMLNQIISPFSHQGILLLLQKCCAFDLLSHLFYTCLN